MLLELLELAGNNALAHDTGDRAWLQKLAGKTMVLMITPMQQSIAVSCHPEGFEFSSTLPEQVDVTLVATVGALIKISRDGLEEADLQAGELEISGDPIIGQRFAQVLSQLDIDWEAFMAEHVGDTPAYYIARAAGTARDVAAESKIQIRARMQKMLVDDLALLANKEDVEHFLDAVDELRADTDRLAAKIKRLQA